MATVGYARTSTIDQVAGLEDQIAQLRKSGVERCFSEHASALGERPQLTACLAWLREGDVLVVTKPDRLARSVPLLLELVSSLQGRSVGLRILSLDMDTTTPTGRLSLTILGAVAAWEREIMLERQRAGIAKAKADGKYRGRKAVVALRAEEIYGMMDRGLGDTAIAQALGCHRQSVWRVRKARPTIQPPTRAIRRTGA